MYNHELRQILMAQIALLQNAVALIDRDAQQTTPLPAAKVEPVPVDTLMIGQSFLFNGALLTIQHVPHIKEGGAAKVGCVGKITAFKDGFENTTASAIYLSRAFVEQCVQEVVNGMVG